MKKSNLLSHTDAIKTCIDEIHSERKLLRGLYEQKKERNRELEADKKRLEQEVWDLKQTIKKRDYYLTYYARSRAHAITRIWVSVFKTKNMISIIKAPFQSVKILFRR